MKQPPSDLERLITRYLDDEATSRERRELDAWTRSDPNAEALLDDYAALDREFGNAIRGAMGRTRIIPVGRSVWSRATGLVGLAAAACLALLVWMQPPPSAVENGRDQSSGSVLPSSWFVPAVPQDRVMRQANRSFERPQRRQRNLDREWILVPGEGPGEYLVIEVNRVRTRAVNIQGDF
ncbi:MAG: hypothetical protein ABIG44_19380 [Planctomycetota bacterium]